MFGFIKKAKDMLIKAQNVAGSIWNRVPTIFAQQQEENDEVFYDARRTQEEANAEEAQNLQEANAEKNRSIEQMTRDAFNRAHTAPAPTFIQKLKKRAQGIAESLQSKITSAPVQRLGSMVAGFLGGKANSLYKAFSMKTQAISTAFHAFKALEAGIAVVGLFIETVKAIVQTIVTIVTGIFDGLVELFTGFKDAAVEVFTPETEDGEKDYSLPAVLGVGAIAGLGALYQNRATVQPQAQEATEFAKEKATQAAGAAVEGFQKCAQEGFEYVKGLFNNCEETRQFNMHKDNAVKGFADVRDAMNNFNGNDAARVIKYLLKQ